MGKEIRHHKKKSNLTMHSNTQEIWFIIFIYPYIIWKYFDTNIHIVKTW